MSYVKSKKTRISIGSGLPASETLAAAVTAADTSFECLIETMNGFDLSRGTSDDPTVHCNSDDSFTPSDTDDLKVSNFTIEGMVDDESANGYDAVYALGIAMIKADAKGTLVITEPNGTDKLWAKVKVASLSKMRGGAQDKQKFKIEFVALSLPSDA